MPAYEEIPCKILISAKALNNLTEFLSIAYQTYHTMVHLIVATILFVSNIIKKPNYDQQEDAPA